MVGRLRGRQRRRVRGQQTGASGRRPSPHRRGARRRQGDGSARSGPRPVAADEPGGAERGRRAGRRAPRPLPARRRPTRRSSRRARSRTRSPRRGTGAARSRRPTGPGRGRAARRQPRPDEQQRGEQDRPSGQLVLQRLAAQQPQPRATARSAAAGQHTTANSGTASSSHPGAAGVSSRVISSGSAGTPTISPQIAARRRSRARPQPSDAAGCAGARPSRPARRCSRPTPGTYLPSWPTKKMPPAGATCSREPEVGHQHPPAQHGEDRADEREHQRGDRARASTRRQVGRRPPPVAGHGPRHGGQMTTATTMRRVATRRRRGTGDTQRRRKVRRSSRRRRRPDGRVAGLAHACGDVTVEVADQDEADVVGAGQDAAHLGRPDGALRGGRPERQRQRRSGRRSAAPRRPGSAPRRRRRRRSRWGATG